MWPSELSCFFYFCSSHHFCLLFTLDSSQSGNFCHRLTCLVVGCLCLRNLHCFRCWNRFVHHVELRNWNMTSVRNVVLVSLFCTLCGSSPLRFDAICPHDLSWNMKSSVFWCPSQTKRLHGVDPSLNRSGWLVWWLWRASLRLSLFPIFFW